MERLTLIENQLATKTSIVNSAWDYLKFDDLFPPDISAYRKEIRTWLEKDIQPQLMPYIEKAEFPEFFVEKLKEKDLVGKFFRKPYGEGWSNLALAAIVVELSRVDASLATFFLVDSCLLGFTIEEFASEETKKKYLPKMRDLSVSGGWALTEDLIGSDASNLKTTATKTQGGYKISGTKRWIGNADRDIATVWAKNAETKKIECFLVELKSTGVKREAIKHKLPLRMVQNMHLNFDNVFVPEENKLPKAVDFTSTGKVLLHSRIFVTWVAIGISIGVYDNTIKYCNERMQFGVKITSFQLIQDKLVKMMGNIQAMMHLNYRITSLYDRGLATIGMIAMTKAWCTKLSREVCQLGREAMGGNGIIMDNYAMKAVADIEAIYTYEGTYDINTLVCGRELTGVAAFKAGK